MIEKKDERYVLGILHAVQFVNDMHGLNSIAEDMVRELLQGWPLEDLKTLAKKQDTPIDWKQVTPRELKH